MNSEAGRWIHLNQYECRYLRETRWLYDEVIAIIDDVPRIASRYQLKVEDVQRAKDYAFGCGVAKYQFSPDSRMAEAWQRMALGKGTDIDEVLLRHEVYESALVIDGGLSTQEAHQLAHQRYPWSDLIDQTKPP